MISSSSPRVRLFRTGLVGGLAACLLSVGGAPALAQSGAGTGSSAAAQPDTSVQDARDDAPVRGTRGAQAEAGVVYDAWGARRNLGLAIGEVALVNAVVWGYNEYIRGANFTQVNPRSWLENIKGGFFYDDNHFSNNQFAHPFHGSLYYSAARTNGFGYFASVPFAIMGSYFWECCGETHPPAINDWIATALGGAAIGEMTYRASSAFLDNEATGFNRTWREIATTLMNPIRGFNRLVSGRWTRVYPNPTTRHDRRPRFFESDILAGVRVIGNTRSLSGGDIFSDTTEVHGVFEYDLFYGSPFDDSRRKPFDWFSLGLQVNFGDKKPLGRVQIRGNLYSSDMKRSDKTTHVFAVTHWFEYVNNNAVEFGATSAAASIYSRFKLSDKFTLRSGLDAVGTLMGAVNSEFAFLAELPDRERLREYDYGPGLGARVVLNGNIGGWDAFTLVYRFQWIHTLNGSTVNGSDSEHILQSAGIRAKVPVYRNFGIGADAFAYLRNSYFGPFTTESGDVVEFPDITQRVPQVRVYLVWEHVVAPPGL